METIHATRIWLLLVVLTFLVYGLSVTGYRGLVFVMIVVLTSFLKGKLIIDHFMMLRQAPLVWRLLVTLWLLIILMVIAGLYYFRG